MLKPDLGRRQTKTNWLSFCKIYKTCAIEYCNRRYLHFLKRYQRRQTANNGGWAVSYKWRRSCFITDQFVLSRIRLSQNQGFDLDLSQRSAGTSILFSITNEQFVPGRMFCKYDSAHVFQTTILLQLVEIWQFNDKFWVFLNFTHFILT